MAYSGVYVFGDSLVDSGNALKLAETYDYFPFTSLPDGAPTSGKGYHSGNFTNGWTLVDLISNKYLGVTTKTVFPFGYEEPFLGISFGFVSDPDGNNLNFAYGGAQLRQGDEAVPDIDDQTDAFRDAVDGDADPNALHIFSFGANDVHDLVPNSGQWADRPTAEARLADCAGEYIQEILQLVDIGAQHILVTGVPDIGIQPIFNGTPDEAARRAIATEYSNLLDQMIRDRLDALNLPDGVEIHYVSWEAMQAQVIGTMASLYGTGAVYPLEDSDVVFFDQVHPTAQVHALGAAYMIDLLTGPAGETMALTAPDFSSAGSISAKGEVDSITIALAANTYYSFDMLGISTLGGNVLTLADPMLKIFGPGGTLLASNDDGGLGLDASLSFTNGAAGEYRLQLSGVGAMTGNYEFRAAGAADGNNFYNVTTGATIVLEGIGGGADTVAASVSYALNAGAEIELLQTSNAKGKTAINLTGNEFSQTIVGNAGSNIIEGKAGADVMTGGAGKDVFVLSMAAVTDPGAANIDRITDYGSGDIVDLSQILSVAAGTNVASGGYVRVTTSGLIQVDSDGGGNNWVTLSQINNGGAVTVRYLSGGVATIQSLSRVAATTNVALASAVAAAGLMTAPSAAQPHGNSSDSMSGALVAAAGSGGHGVEYGVANSASMVPGLVAQAVEDSGLVGAQARPGRTPDDHSLTRADAMPGRAADEHAAAAQPAGHEPAALHVLAAPAVAMPSAEMLLSLAAEATPDITAQLLAEALFNGPPDVEQLLARLPHGRAEALALKDAPAWDGMEVPTMAFQQLPLEALALHPDTAPAA